MHDTLAQDTWSVVAFGGGAVIDPVNRDLARATALVVWLQAPVRELARRVSASIRRSGGGRPLLTAPGVAGAGDAARPEAILEALAASREESYRAAAHLCVETTGKSPGQVATAVLAAARWEKDRQ